MGKFIIKSKLGNCIRIRPVETKDDAIKQVCNVALEAAARGTQVVFTKDTELISAPRHGIACIVLEDEKIRLPVSSGGDFAELDEALRGIEVGNKGPTRT